MADYERVMEEAERIHRQAHYRDWRVIVSNHFIATPPPVTIGYSPEVRTLLDSKRYRPRRQVAAP